MKKRICAVLLALAVMASFAGCSSGKGAAETSKSNESAGAGTSKAETTATVQKEVTLKLGLPGGYGITSQKIVDSFKTKYPNVKLDIDEAPWGDFVGKITTQIAGGNAPDVWFQENAVVIGYGAKGAAEDLAPYIQADIKSDDYVAALYSSKVGDKVWGIPHGINPIALAYNKKIFTDANVPFPTDAWTYQDLVDTAIKLTKDENKDGTPEIYGFLATAGITQGWFPWIKAKGGQILDPTLTKAAFDDPKTLEGVTLWSDLVNKYKVSPTEAVNKALGGDFQIFGNNKAAMFFIQYSTANSIVNKNFPDLDYDTVKIPIGFDGKRVVPMVSNCWVIFSKASQEGKDAAWLWIKNYLSEESQDIVAESGASIPLLKSSQAKLGTAAFKPANKEAFTKGIEEAGTTLDENASWNQWRAEANPILVDILYGKVQPADGLKQIQEKVQKVLDENK